MSAVIHNYKVLEKIGQGQFGLVYRGIHEKRGNAVAIKCEPHNTPFKLLKRETTILNMVYHKEYIPPILWFGKHEIWQVLVMPYYPMSLETYIVQKLFPAQSPQRVVQYLHNNILDILSHIHKHNVVHRDIKPQNLMVQDNKLVLIDFGLALFTVDGTGAPLPTPRVPHEHITGNAKYASINTHYGCSISPKDENISAFYILLWMVYGRLPWSHPPTFSHTNYDVTHVLHPANLYMRGCKEWESIRRFVAETAPLDGDVEYWSEEMVVMAEALAIKL